MVSPPPGHNIKDVNRDLIAIGGSAGGVEVLLALVGELPAKLPAAILVVLHTSPMYLSPLPGLLSKRGPLEALYPVHNQELLPGKIYIAPPDTQLQVRAGYVEVVRGPRENGHRPAVDALFRTASWAYGPRVVGVVLSGHGDCGTAGMMSIKARGGVAVAQTPETALAPDMPKSAIDRVNVDHVVHPVELPGLLTRLAGERVWAKQAPVAALIDQMEGKEPGTAVELVCPTCQGVLTEARTGDFQHFRCHVGHAFSLDSLALEQSEELERALWAAVRALEESAALSRRLSASNAGELSSRFADKERTHGQHAEAIRRILLSGDTSTRNDSPKSES